MRGTEQQQNAAKEADFRTCTCHPDDSPPTPCPRKFALGECRAAELEKLAERNRYDSIGRALDLLLANGELDDYDDEIANRVEEAAKIVRAVTVMHFVPLKYVPNT
jgi:hypothetical protein